MYPAYPAYSATRWPEVGGVPAGWEARRLKFSVSLRNQKIEAEVANLEYMGLEHIESWTGKRIEDETASSEGVATHFVKDDVLFGKLRPYLAKVYLAEKEGMATTEALILKTEPALVPPFLKYQLLSDKFIDAVSGATYGAKMPRANWEAIGSLPILLPSLDEQQQIAAFLDWKTGQIDALIAKKQALIEKLKEKRLAVITQAVTQGLDPATPLRDSGIPWLGQVPAHWEVKKLSRVTASRCDGPFGSGLKSEHYSDDGVRVIRLQNITFAEFDDEDKAFIDTDYYSGLGDHDVFPGDLLVAGLGDKNNPVGRACCAPDNLGPAMVKADCFRYRLEGEKANSQFMAYQMSVTATALSGALASGVTRPRMNLSLTSDRILAFPPVDEQIEIANYLNAESRNNQRMVEKVDSAIARLTEYRTALITAATTGKIDVRQVAIPGYAKQQADGDNAARSPLPEPA